MNEEDDHNKHVLMAALRGIDAKIVIVRYSGGGDSGQIDDCVIDSDPDKNADVEVEDEYSGLYVEGQGIVNVERRVTKKLTDALIDFCDHILDNLHAGCFNNDGADGDFELDVEAGTLTNTHNENYTSQNTTTSVIELRTTVDDMADAIGDKKKKGAR